MANEQRLQEQAAQVLADLHGCGVVSQAARKIVIDALRKAFEDGQRDAADDYDPMDE